MIFVSKNLRLPRTVGEMATDVKNYVFFRFFNSLLTACFTETLTIFSIFATIAFSKRSIAPAILHLQFFSRYFHA